MVLARSEMDLADEMAVVTWATDEMVRRDSYRLLAKAAGITKTRTGD
jgi:hypothetical protein